MNATRRFTLAAVAAAAAVSMLAAPALRAQEYATPFGPSSQDAVNRMLKLAALKDGDVVADLGSGNGQIIIGAARSNPKVRGWGVDLQEWLVKTATEEAARQGVVHCVLPAVEVANFEAVRALAHAGGDSYALGIHPLYVGQAADDDLHRLDAALTRYRDDPRLVARRKRPAPGSADRSLGPLFWTVRAIESKDPKYEV
jgi:precorrin-6B methylase 2